MSKQSYDLPTELPNLPEYIEAPPDYDTVIQIPDRQDVPAPAFYDPPTLEGLPQNELYNEPGE